MDTLADTLPRIKTLTFDCYGTLIDWRSGLRASLTDLFGGADSDQSAVLYQDYVSQEAEVEGGPYQPYRKVLAEAAERVAAKLGITIDSKRAENFADTVPDWPPFPDTIDALRRLKKKFKLGVLSNIDRDIFAKTAQRLEDPFDFVVTAQDVRAYKPAHAHFDRLFHDHEERPSVLHVAQSLFHDGLPAGELGLAFIWINRYKESNMTEVKPLETFGDLTSLASACGV